MACWRITHAPSFRPLVADLPDEPRRALTDIYRVLSRGPLPGESVLEVEPLPGATDTYTVPFAGAGFLLYVVDQPRRTVELIGMIWLGSDAGSRPPPRTYSRSVGDMRRWASRARASAAEAP